MNLAKQTPKSTPTNPSNWLTLYGDDLYRFAITRLRDPDASEEVVQQTLVAGLEARGQYSGAGSEKGWLFGILRRKVVDFIRQRVRDREMFVDGERDQVDVFFDSRGNWRAGVRSVVVQSLDSLERAEFWKILRSCLDALPTRQADVFVLREMDDCSTEEICKEMNISPSNLWVLLHRARLQLSNCMKWAWQKDTQ